MREHLPDFVGKCSQNKEPAGTSWIVALTLERLFEPTARNHFHSLLEERVMSWKSKPSWSHTKCEAPVQTSAAPFCQYPGGQLTRLMLIGLS